MKFSLLIHAKGCLLVLLFLVGETPYFAQQQGKKEAPGQKTEEHLFHRPSSYDSTKLWEEQYKPENRYQFLGLRLSLPQIIDSEAGPIVFSNKQRELVSVNRNYTVVDILTGDQTALLKQKKLINICGHRYRDLDSQLWKELIHIAVVVLKDEQRKDSLNNDLLYWVISQSKQTPYSDSYFDALCPAPYFSKLVQLYEGKNIVLMKDKSTWHCKSVTMLKRQTPDGLGSYTQPGLLLDNSKGEILQVLPPSAKNEKPFLTEEEYERLIHANRNMKNEMMEAEQKHQANHKAACIKAFGQLKGEVVFKEEIEKGMTREMCYASWGAPWKILKISGDKEVWMYTWNYKLHFEQGILVKIEH